MQEKKQAKVQLMLNIFSLFSTPGRNPNSFLTALNPN